MENVPDNAAICRSCSGYQSQGKPIQGDKFCIKSGSSILRVRRKVMKYLLLTVFGLFLVGQAAAQSGRVSVRGYVREGERKDIEGAVVEIISGSDTLRAVTTRYGTFIVKNVNMGDAIVRISHLSYKPYERKIVVKKGDAPLKIELELAAQEIEDVTVKTYIPLYKMSGDTLIYNAAAIKTWRVTMRSKFWSSFPVLFSTIPVLRPWERRLPALTWTGS